MSKLRYPISGPKTTGILLSLVFVLLSHLVAQAQCPVVNAGADGNICTNGSYNLSPILNGDYGSVAWTTSGQGTFLPNSFEEDAVYIPGGSDLDGIVLTLTLRAFPNDPIACPDVYSDQLQLTVVAAPTADAGAVANICSGSSLTVTDAVASNYFAVQWAVVSGTTGTLTNHTALNPTFTPSAGDISNGVAQIRLFAYGNPPCGNTTGDIKTINITQAPAANAGSVAATCGTNPAQIVGASASNYSTITWTSSGSGTFSNANDLNPTYTPSAGDVANGSAILTLTATGNGSCSSVSSNTTLTINSTPIVNAGIDRETCGFTAIDITGTASGHTGVLWTTNQNGTFTSPNTLITNYTPGSTDLAAGSATLTLTATNGCGSASDVMILTITAPPTANAGPTINSCGLSAVPVSGASATNHASVSWSSSGGGTFTNPNSLATTYQPTAGDVAGGSVILTLTAFGNGSCADVTSTRTLNFTSLPIANAGPNDNTCVNQAYTFANGQATVTGSYEEIVWTHNGNGQLQYLAGNRLRPIYTPDALDAGQVITLTMSVTPTSPCVDIVTDQMDLTINALPTANAGNDVDVCTTAPSYSPNGTATNYSSLEWTIVSGFGSLANANALSPTYTIHANDITQGFVALRLTAFGNGTCTSTIDQMTITFVDPPTAFAGDDRTLCASNTVTITDADATNYASLLWTIEQGAGSILAGTETTLTPVYQSVVADGGNSVMLRFTATANTGCGTNAVDYVEIDVFASPTVNMGIPSAETCGSSGYNLLNANPTATNYSTLSWTSSGTGAFNDNTILYPVYTPSAQDIIDGLVILTLTANPIAPCASSGSASLTLTINQEPTVFAGPDIAICEGNTHQLTGTASNYQSVLWTSSGDGSFLGGGTPTPIYTPGATDIITGSVLLTITAQPVSPCGSVVTDDMTLNINPAPVGDAGSNAAICSHETYDLAGSAANYSSFSWSSSSGGSFVPSNVLDPTFTPSAAEIAAGFTVIRLTVNPTAACITPVFDEFTLTINTGPTANAGIDATICQTGYLLNGSATNASSVLWTTAGDGLFDDATIQTPYYTPGPVDIASGTVNLTLTAQPVAPCAVASSDIVVLTIRSNPQAIAHPGGSDEICETAGSYTLSQATASNYTSLLWTSSSGGSFSDNTTLNPVYYPSATDIAVGFVDLTITASNAPCNEVSNTMRLFVRSEPTAYAGANRTICVGDIVALNDATATPTGASVAWSVVVGSGTFSNENIANPIFSPTNYAIGSITLRLTVTAPAPCVNVVTDDMIIYITQPPTVDVGLVSDEICESDTYTVTTATASNHDGLEWTTSGDGTFVGGNTLTPTYTPGTQDALTGQAILTLTATPENPCNVPVSESFTLNIQREPLISAGPDRNACEGNAIVIGGATAQFYSVITWTTSGSGGFGGTENDVTPTYTPSAADAASGIVTLTMTAQSELPCVAVVTDQMILTIVPDAQVFAGVDATICGNGFGYFISDATAQDYSTISWTSSGDGTFSPNATAIRPTYTPGPNDIATGSVTLELTGINQAGCSGFDTDQMTITINPMPTAYAGPNDQVCDLTPYTLSSATFEQESSVEWSSTGTGSFNNTALENPTYTPSAFDLSVGFVDLTVRAYGLLECVTDYEEDVMRLSFVDSPIADAGPDQITCEDGIQITDATASNYNTLLWSSSGSSGTLQFANTISPYYTPSALDIATGFVILTLTAQPDAPCAAPAIDDVRIDLETNPVISAGPDDAICENEDYLITATGSNYQSLNWTSSGDGSFLNNGTLNPTYLPGTTDISNGNVVLTLTAQPIAPCSDPVTDAMLLTINQLPLVDAGPNATICTGATHTTLLASATNAVSTVWTSAGDGIFANPNQLNTVYTPGANDLTNGSVQLTLTATSNAVCGSVDVSDNLILTITAGPTADAGSDATICASENYLVFDASATNHDPASIVWTTNRNGTFINGNSLSPTYVPGTADIAAGNATITLTVNGQAPCTGAASDQFLLTINPIAVADIGPDDATCEATGYQLTGVVAENYSAFNWSHNGFGSFSNAGTLSPTYNPAPEDIGQNVIITLTLNSNPPCTAIVTDEMTLSIEGLPSVFAGNDANICGTGTYSLTEATATDYASLAWTTTGTGVFSNSNALNPVYTPSAADITTGNVVLTLTALSNAPCAVNPSDSFTLTLIGPATANAGTDASTCVSTAFTVSSASTTNAAALNWTHNGSGTISGAGTLTPTYTPSAGDAINGSVTLTLTASGNAPCADATDQMILTVVPNPTVNIGPDATACENTNYQIVNFSGTAYSTVAWTTSGTGTFSNPAISLPVYLPSAADIMAGNVTLTATVTGNAPCATTDDDSFVLSFTDAPTVSAGVDETICAGSTLQITTATASNAISYLWTSSGTGTFTSSTNLNPVYTPSAADINQGSVTLTITANGTPPCASVNDQMTLTINPSVVADAGQDESVCQGFSFTVGDATASNYSSLAWTSSGGGAFSNTNTLTPTYTPDANDIANGLVTLTLTATSIAPCTQIVVSSMQLTIQPSATADAGAPATVCQPNSYTVSDATATNAATINWTSSGSGSFINANTLTPTYSPSNSDYISGSVTLTLTVSSNAPCATTVNSSKLLSLQATPDANAGSNATICETSTYTVNNASASNYVNLYWTTSGTGVLANDNTINPTYNPSAADINAGSVTLTLHLEGAAPCGLESSDDMTLAFTLLPAVYAGADASLCDGDSYTITDATASYYSNFNWQSTGSGSFTNANTLSPTYTPSAADFANSSVIITLTANANNPCTGSVSDALTLSLYESVLADAGTDATICGGSTYTLNGNAENHSNVVWSTNGTGTFSNTGNLNAIYTPSAADISAGSVILTLTATGIPPCATTVSDNMVLTITPNPTAFAGTNATVCASSHTITDAAATNYSALLWTSNGSGNLTNPTSLTPAYTPSAADLVAGNVTLTLTVTGQGTCNGLQASDQVVLTFLPLPTANAGVDQTICSNETVNLSGSASNYASVQWITSGDGAIASPTSLSTIYTPGTSDINNGSVDLTFRVFSNPPCTSFEEDVLTIFINPIPVVNAGPDQTTCNSGGYLITSASSLNHSALNWTTNGSGSFSNSTIINPTYFPSAADLTVGSAVLTLEASSVTCPGTTISDSFILTFESNATANAGPDATICQGSTYTVSGANATNAVSYNWTSSGTGSFFNQNTLTPTYTPSNQDINLGNVTLTLTASGQAPCNSPAADSFILTIRGNPVANAGADVNVCETSNYTVTDASVANAASFFWTTTGTGTLANGGLINPTYTPSAQDIINGSVVLILNANAQAPCGGTVTDSKLLTFSGAPLLDAGPDHLICAGGNVFLGGATASNYSSVTWTSNGTGFFNNPNSLNATYYPSANDISLGTINLTIELVPDGACAGSGNLTDFVDVIFTAGVTAYAGQNGIICAGDFYSIADATANGGGNPLWSTSGTGTFNSATILNPVYTPSQADINSGSVTLSLMIQGTGSCAGTSDTDEMTLTIVPEATVDLGADQSTCGILPYELTGTFAQNYQGLLWQTSGTGTFNNNTLANPIYTPSVADMGNGSVIISLTATSVAPCLDDATDSFILNISTQPEANLGPDQSICENQTITLSSNALNYSTLQWVSSGSGSFSSLTNPNTIYTPSADDILNGSVEITVEVTGIGGCSSNTISENLLLTIDPLPTLSLMGNQLACDPAFQVSGTAASNYNTLQWQSSGTGTFDDVSILNPVYTASAADITAGTITLSLVATALNPCTIDAFDSFTVTFSDQPTADAGLNATIAAGDSYTLADATATNYLSLSWTTSGDGSFSNNTILNPIYTPGTSDIAAGTVTLTLTSSGGINCTDASDDMTLMIQPEPAAYAGPDEIICANQTFIPDQATASNYGVIIWSTNGDGTFDDNNLLQPTYTPGAGDIASGTATLTITATCTWGCPDASDDLELTITALPTAFAGNNLSTCGTQAIQITDAQTTNSGSLQWSHNGAGTLDNNAIINPTYSPVVADAGSIVTLTLTAYGAGNCITESAVSTVDVEVETLPAAFAGSNQLTCVSQSIQIPDAVVNNAASFIWTHNGNGSLDFNNVIDPIYTPAPADAGSTVVLTLTAAGSGSCSSQQAVSTVSINVSPAPTAFAGTNVATCNTQSVQITDASVSNASGLLWTHDGSGTLNATTVINPVYTPSPADAGNLVTLTLTATGIGGCIGETAVSTVIVQVDPLPTVFAGNNRSSCISQSVQINDATVNNASTFVWAHNGSGSLDANNVINPTYTPAPADAGNIVTLTLTATGDNSCGSQTATSNVLIQFDPLPTANAGQNLTLCVTQDIQITTAEATNYSLLNWTHNGSGSFDAINILNPTYTPALADAGNIVMITLTAQGSGNCGAEVAVSSAQLTINPLPTAFAGTNVNTCVSQSVQINDATVTNAGAIAWTHNGAGTLNASTIINPVYTPGIADAGNTVTLTLTAYGDGFCATETSISTVQVIVGELPDVFAGTDRIICENQSIQITDATANNASSFAWSHNGAGSLNATNIINPTYTPAASDAGNNIILTLTAHGSGSCAGEVASSTVQISVNSLPEAFAGSNTSTCVTQSVQILNASASFGGSILWAHNGNGTLNANNIINPIYAPAPADGGNTVTLTLTVTGQGNCNLETAMSIVQIQVSALPIVFAGTDRVTCETQPMQINDASATNYATFGWSHNGYGSLDNNNVINPTYTPVLADAGTIVTLTLTVEGTESCSSSIISDQVEIDVIAQPVVNTGADRTSCSNSNYQLANVTANHYQTLNWISSGSGSFIDPTILNPVYVPSLADYSAGSVILTLTATPFIPCANNVSDSFVLSFEDGPQVFAGNDVNICAGQSYTLSEATASDYTSLSWTSSGTGLFDDPSMLRPVYTPSNADYQNGSVVLTLSADGASLCPQATDDITISFTATPIANAGPDLSICENGTLNITLASASNYATLQWFSGGDGFFDNPFVINPTYTPGASDINNGSVWLTLVASANLPCTGQASDQMMLILAPQATADAGGNITSCENDFVVIENATAENYSSLVWTTSGSGTFMNNGTIAPTYIPSGADVVIGSVNLTLTASSIAPCNVPAVSVMTITFEDGPQANSGADAVICEGDTYTTSTATASNYSSLQWNTSGTGSFTNASILETTYIPSAADINSGLVTLTLTAIGNMPCPEVVDAMTLTINGDPTAFAGTTTAICTGPNVLEGATATNYSSISWSTTGTGSFINGNSLTPIYTASALDLANSPITFTLTAMPIAPCAGPAAVHTIIVDVFEGANIDAGANATICQGSTYTIADAFVDASVTNILWTTSGTGTFNDPTIANPTYTPSAADILTGSATLTMTASNPACGDQSDYMVLTINRYPQVNAGADDFVCISGSYTVQDASIANNYASFTWSVVIGNGTLLNPASLTPTYIPDITDLGTQITLMLTAEAAAPCTGTFSEVKLLTVTDNPVADAGSDATICETDTYTINNAAAQNYSSLNWATNGTGVFANQGSINPTYVPSASDIAMGSVILTLEAANPPCLSDFDSMVLSFSYLPDVFAGYDATIDIGSSFQITTATVANYSSFEWSTSGTGTFDDISVINPVYTPSNQDFAWGSVHLTLTAEGNAPCNGQTVSDYMILTVTNYPAVDFTWDISCANWPVQFYIDEDVTDIGAIVSYNWNFGDGTTSNLMEPQHTFVPAGTYIVSLTVVDTANYSNTVQHFVEVNALPVALFYYMEPSCHGEPTEFFSNSSSIAGYITEWHWDFGDGNSTTISFPNNPNVTHTYLLSGLYTATLTVTSSTGCIAADVNTVTIQPSPVAAFEYSGNCAGNPVQFTDLSQNNSGSNIVSWSWNFGDPLSGQSNTSNLQHPTHQFTSAGVFDVVLTIENAMGCSSEVTEQVVVTDPPALSILVDEPGVCLGEAIQFTADVANAVSWLWNFGDGNTSTLPNPAHTYQFAGNYTVSVLIQDIDGCSASASLPITVYNHPTANFSNTNPGCDAGPVQFTDLSVSPNGQIVEWFWDFGDGSTSTEQNPEYSYATTGTFVVTLLVTDAVGCTDDFIRQISIDGSPLADFTFTAACEGQAVMFTDLSSPNGGADITFWAWNFGDPLSGANNTSSQQNPSHTFVGTMPAGGYTVTLTITNADGCSNTTFELVELSPAPPVAILVDDPVVCLGETILFNGEADNVVSWLWNFGDGNSSSIQNPIHSYLVTGTFNVTLTIVTAQGCVNTATTQIVVNAPPVAGFTTNSPVCFESPVQFNNTSVSPNGNIQTWIWNFGDGTSETVISPDNPNVEHTYTLAGTYNVTLTVIDNAGCEDDLTRQVIVEYGPLANFTYEGSCFGNPFLFTDLSSPNGGPDLFSWNWDFGDPLSGVNNQSNLPNPSHVFTEPGIYTVTLAVTNTLGCTNTIELVIEVEALPDVDFTFEEEPFCPGEQIQFTSIGDNLTTWLWNFGDGGTSIIANPTYIYTEPGSYLVSLTATNTDGCQGIVSHTIAVEPAPNANFTSTSPSCEGAPIFFSNTSNSSTGFIEQWIWNFGDGSPEVVIDWPDNPDVEHTYALLGSYNASLTVVNSNGCTDTEVKVVQVIPAPVAAFDFIGTCAESPVNFIDLSQENGGGAIVSWHWNFGDPGSGVNNESFLQNPTHSFTAPGDYPVTLTITNANGCESFVEAIVTISEAIQVEIQVDNQTACFGEPLQFNGVSDVATFWFWDFGDGNTSTLQNPLHTYTNIGTFTVVLTAEDANGCSNTDIVEITVYPQPEANFISTAPSCSNNEVEFTDTSISPNGLIVEWLWDFGDGNSSTEQNPVYAYEFPGSYEVTLLVTDIEGCSDEIMQLVQISNEPLAQFIYEDDCASSPVLFTDISSTNGGPDLYSWFWEFGDPQSGVNNTSTLQNPSHLFVGPMPDDGYLVTLIVTNTSGCTDTVVEPVLVGQLPEIAIEVSSDTLCAGEVVEFTGIGDDITSWFWNFGDGGVSTQQNPTYVYVVPGSYTVTLTATHLNGCEGIATQQIGVGQQPIANFEHENNCFGEITQFTDLSVSPGAIVSEWLWDFGDGIMSTEQNPAHEYAAVDDYFVTLTVTNNYGCQQSISRWVSIFDSPQAAFNFMQVCEPNGRVYFFDQSQSGAQGSPIVEYMWHFHGDYYASELNPNFIFPVPDSCYVVTLTVTDAFGCSSVVEDTVCIWQPIQLEFTSTEVCIGEETFFEAFHFPEDDTIISYTWNFNDGTPDYVTIDDTVSHTFGQAGTYFVELTALNQNGCTSTIYRQVVVNALPIPDFTYVAGICDEPTQFTDASQGNGAPIDSWFWDFGDGNTSTDRNPSHIYSTQEGTYEVSLTVTNLNGCENTIVKEIYKEPCLQASFILPFGNYCAQSEICFEENSIMIASDGEIIGYEWDFGDGTTLSYVNQQNPICHTWTPGFDGFEGGEFDVSLTITGEVGGSLFTHTFTETITIRPKPEARFIPAPVCQGTLTQFEDNSIGHGEPVVGWNWNFGDLTSIDDTSSMQNPAYEYPSHGFYDVELIVRNEYGCSDTLVRETEIWQRPEADFSYDVNCASYQTLFFDESVEGGAEIIGWHWDFGMEGDTAIDQNTFYVYDEADAYEVLLVVNDENQCYDTILRTVYIYPIPRADFTIQDEYQGRQGQVYFRNESESANSYFWDFDDGNINDVDFNPVHQYTEDGTYEVMLVAYNEYNCPDTLVKEYTILFTGLYFPNTFVPQSTNPELNKFMGIGENLESYSVEVYSSWGQLVYSSTHLTLDGNPDPDYAWDGKFKGQDLPVGSYIWRASAVFRDGSIWKGADNGDGNIRTYGLINIIW